LHLVIFPVVTRNLHCALSGTFHFPAT
jgi:hypothetical protein